MNPVRVGVVGTGRAAVLHAEAVRAARGAELAGLASRRPQSSSARALAAALSTAPMTLEELARSCEAVVIAVPPAAQIETAETLSAVGGVRAALVESPAGVTLEAVNRLRHALGGLAALGAVNLLHAAAVRRLFDTVATMAPHHLLLRVSVPTPSRGPQARRLFGGGVLVDPGTGFWPVLMTAIGAAVESVAASEITLDSGSDTAARLLLSGSDGSFAGAEISWGAQVAAASVEAADADRVARLEVWPAPVLELNGVPVHASDPEQSNPLAALGFVEQIRRLVRVCRGEAAAWPGIDVSSTALAVAVAAAVSARRSGAPAALAEAPANLSVREILST